MKKKRGNIYFQFSTFFRNSNPQRSIKKKKQRSTFIICNKKLDSNLGNNKNVKKIMKKQPNTSKKTPKKPEKPKKITQAYPLRTTSAPPTSHESESQKGFQPRQKRETYKPNRRGLRKGNNYGYQRYPNPQAQMNNPYQFYLSQKPQQGFRQRGRYRPNAKIVQMGYQGYGNQQFQQHPNMQYTPQQYGYNRPPTYPNQQQPYYQHQNIGYGHNVPNYVPNKSNHPKMNFKKPKKSNPIRIIDPTTKEEVKLVVKKNGENKTVNVKIDKNVEKVGNLEEKIKEEKEIEKKDEEEEEKRKKEEEDKLEKLKKEEDERKRKEDEDKRQKEKEEKERIEKERIKKEEELKILKMKEEEEKKQKIEEERLKLEEEVRKKKEIEEKELQKRREEEQRKRKEQEELKRKEEELKEQEQKQKEELEEKKIKIEKEKLKEKKESEHTQTTEFKISIKDAIPKDLLQTPLPLQEQIKESELEPLENNTKNISQNTMKIGRKYSLIEMMKLKELPENKVPPEDFKLPNDLKMIKKTAINIKRVKSYNDFNRSNNYRNTRHTKKRKTSRKRIRLPPRVVVDPETIWRPNQKKDLKNDFETITREVILILNKITPEKYELLRDEFIGVDIKDEEILKEVIMRMFDVAVNFPEFCDIYAKLFNDLCNSKAFLNNFKLYTTEYSDEKVEVIDIQSKSKHIKKILLDKCQTVYQQSFQVLYKDGVTEKEKKVAIGNIFFIAALFKQQMLSRKIMHEVIKELFHFIYSDQPTRKIVDKETGKEKQLPPDWEIIHNSKIEHFKILIKLMHKIGERLDAIQKKKVEEEKDRIKKMMVKNDDKKMVLAKMIRESAEKKLRIQKAKENLKKIEKASYMGYYFRIFKIISRSKTVPTLIKFLCKDLYELRKVRKWVVEKKFQKTHEAKKLKEIEADLKQELGMYSDIRSSKSQFHKQSKRKYEKYHREYMPRKFERRRVSNHSHGNRDNRDHSGSKKRRGALENNPFFVSNDGSNSPKRINVLKKNPIKIASPPKVSEERLSEVKSSKSLNSLPSSISDTNIDEKEDGDGDISYFCENFMDDQDSEYLVNKLKQIKFFESKKNSNEEIDKILCKELLFILRELSEESFDSNNCLSVKTEKVSKFFKLCIKNKLLTKKNILNQVGIAVEHFKKQSEEKETQIAVHLLNCFNIIDDWEIKEINSIWEISKKYLKVRNDLRSILFFFTRFSKVFEKVFAKNDKFENISINSLNLEEEMNKKVLESLSVRIPDSSLFKILKNNIKKE